MSLPAFVQEYFACFDAPELPLEQTRFVLLDSETTGLDPRRDRIITIGAVAVIGGEIVLSDLFEVMLKVAYNASSVTVHGITRDEAREGLEEPEALEQFLGWLKNGVIVGHHIGHDVESLNAGYERHWGFRLRNRHMDTMDLTLHLEKAGAFSGQDEIKSFTLDGLCARFGVRPHDRHTAGGDAFITAQIFLRLYSLAKRFHRNTLDAMCEPFPVDSH